MGRYTAKQNTSVPRGCHRLASQPLAASQMAKERKERRVNPRRVLHRRGQQPLSLLLTEGARRPLAMNLPGMTSWRIVACLCLGRLIGALVLLLSLSFCLRMSLWSACCRLIFLPGLPNQHHPLHGFGHVMQASFKFGERRASWWFYSMGLTEAM